MKTHPPTSRRFLCPRRSYVISIFTESVAQSAPKKQNGYRKEVRKHVKTTSRTEEADESLVEKFVGKLATDVGCWMSKHPAKKPFWHPRKENWKSWCHLYICPKKVFGTWKCRTADINPIVDSAVQSIGTAFSIGHLKIPALPCVPVEILETMPLKRSNALNTAENHPVIVYPAVLFPDQSVTSGLEDKALSITRCRKGLRPT